MRPLLTFAALIAGIAWPPYGFAQDKAPLAPAEATPPAPPPPPKPLPIDRSTGQLLGSWEHVNGALQRGDLGEAQRLSAGLSSGQWQMALSPGTSSYLNAALSVLPAQMGGLTWLPLLSSWILVTEPSQQENLVNVLRAIGMLLDGRTPADLNEWDVPASTTRNVCRGLSFVAASASRPHEVRLAALQALGTARRTCATAPADLLVDSSPEIRRAAAALVDGDPATMVALRARLDDDSPEVESLVAARLCRTRGTAAPLAEVLQAARKFAANPVADEDAVELLDCLAASPADRPALQAASVHGSNAVIQARAEELLGRVP